MKVIDIILALIFGRIIGFLMGDFLREWGIDIGLYWGLVIWIGFPLFSLFCLWIANLIGKRILFIFQGAKFSLIGAVGTIIDLKIFELLEWSLSLIIPASYFLTKSISFIISTILRYFGNKYWAFKEHQSLSEFEFDLAQEDDKDVKKEVIQFFLITSVGLIINIFSFYYFAKFLGPQFGVPEIVWIKMSVIFAALSSALWNFCGYKFFVFKK